MRIHFIDKLLIFEADKSPEDKFRVELSSLLIKQFGRGPFKDQKATREIINFSLKYYSEKFLEICQRNTSVRFYQCVFRLHEDVTELVYTQRLKILPEPINAKYVAHYRRILKFILEAGCDVRMVTGESFGKYFRENFEKDLNDLLFIGEMVLGCVELFAEQSIIDELAEVHFDSKELYVFSRQHHYEFIFEDISQSFGPQLKKTVVDNNAIDDLKKALENCFGIKYDDVGHLIASIHEELKPKGGDIVGVRWKTFSFNLNHTFKVPIDVGEQFFMGLKLDRKNKMPFLELACRPHKLNRYMYKPLIEWNIDGEDYTLIGKNAWTETIIQFATNGIPWGKAPEEWLKNECFKKYVHGKENDHDKWLDDAVEDILKKQVLSYDRNTKNLNGPNGSVNINVPGLGEIDFIIIAPKLKKIFICDCKHLLGRYDIVNQRNDFNAFEVGSKKTTPYNTTMTAKLNWFKENKEIVQSHFRKKNNDSTLTISDFEVEGIFIINTPTIYMYNSTYRIYTVEEIADVVQGNYKNKTFSIMIEEEEQTKVLNITYPYFKKPEYVKLDLFDQD